MESHKSSEVSRKSKRFGKFSSLLRGRRSDRAKQLPLETETEQKLEAALFSSTTAAATEDASSTNKDSSLTQTSASSESSSMNSTDQSVLSQLQWSFDEQSDYVEKLNDLIELERKRSREFLEIQTKFNLATVTILDTETEIDGDTGSSGKSSKGRRASKSSTDCSKMLSLDDFSAVSMDERLEYLQQKVDRFRYELVQEGEKNKRLGNEVQVLKHRQMELEQNDSILRTKVSEKDKIIKDIGYVLRRLEKSYEELQQDYAKCEQELYKANNQRERVKMEKKCLEHRYIALFEEEHRMKNKCKLMQTLMRKNKYNELLFIFEDCKRQLVQKEDDFNDLQESMRDMQSRSRSLYEHAFDEHKRLLLVAKLFFTNKNKYKIQEKAYKDTIQNAEQCIGRATELLDLYEKFSSPAAKSSCKAAIEERKAEFAKYLKAFEESLRKCSQKNLYADKYNDEVKKLLLETASFEGLKEPCFPEIDSIEKVI